MRIARVLGNLTLSSRLADLPPGQLLLVQPLSQEAIRGENEPQAETLIAYDERSASVGDRVALSEGREAAMPFHPVRVPVDAYCAAIMDEVDIGEERSRDREIKRSRDRGK
jgi:ethanolamine utilization protein EutN